MRRTLVALLAALLFQRSRRPGAGARPPRHVSARNDPYVRAGDHACPGPDARGRAKAKSRSRLPDRLDRCQEAQAAADWERGDQALPRPQPVLPLLAHRPAPTRSVATPPHCDSPHQRIEPRPLSPPSLRGFPTPSRLPVLFQTLDRNRQWWTTGPLLSSGQRVEFTGSELVWEYYPGQGIQLQVLGTFGKAVRSVQRGRRSVRGADPAAGPDDPAGRAAGRGPDLGVLL